MATFMHLCDLVSGESGTVAQLTADGPMRRRLLDLGLIKNTSVTCIGKSPGGDPSAYYICGAVIAIRRADAASVLIERTAPWG